jgi:hypothetical protein
VIQAESIVVEKAIRKLQQDADDGTLFPRCRLDRSTVFQLPSQAIGIRCTYKGHPALGLREQGLLRIVTALQRKPLIGRLRQSDLLAQGHGHAGTVQITRPMQFGEELVHKPRLWMIDLERLRAFG